tara:strand:+ start:138 stop:1451 length:1314 start_codon:yes stop_codon:yes gene_type:complete
MALDIISGNNEIVWPGLNNYAIDATNIPEAISAIFGQGLAATKLPNGTWVGSLTSLENGATYAFDSTQDFYWDMPTPAPPGTYHPLDFNQDGQVTIDDAILAAQQYGAFTAQMVSNHALGINAYDVNQDGSVDVADIVLAAQNGVPEPVLLDMQSTAFPPPPPPPDNLHPLDFNGDGQITIHDAIYAAQNYGEVVAQMVNRHVLGENAYDLNGDGHVDTLDIIAAAGAGAPQSVIDHMIEVALAPPPPQQEYNPDVEDNYHPLDINQDGEVTVYDAIAASNQGLPQIVSNMIVKYTLGENPYDLDGDGVVSVADIIFATNNQVPQNIIMDMQNNLLSQATPQETPTPEQEVDMMVENQSTDGSEFAMYNGVKYNGLYHYHQLGDDKRYMTGGVYQVGVSVPLFTLDKFDPLMLKEYDEGTTKTINPVPRLLNGGRLF